MAFSKTIPNIGELDLKIRFEYYGKERCSAISIEFMQLSVGGYQGLEDVIRQIKYINRMPVIRVEYKDDEGDFVDLTPNNFTRFLRVVRALPVLSDFPVVNIRVSEGSSPFLQKQLSSDETKRYPTKNSRKELSFEKEDSETAVETTIDLFEYKSPIEYSLETLKEEMIEIETQVESAGEHLEHLNNKYANRNLNKGRGKQCSNCHLRLDHNMRNCTIDKCLTSEQCGDPSKHPDERSLMDSATENLKRLEKELRNKTNEYDTRLKGLNSARSSFAQKIRGALINSKKDKYLVKTGSGMFVPKSGLVNQDIAKLEKHFHGKVPDNVSEMSKTFQSIIQNFDKKTFYTGASSIKNPARKTLEENNVFPVKFPVPSTCTVTSGTSSPASSGIETWPVISPPFVQQPMGPVILYQDGSTQSLSGMYIYI